jgi:hypothetical protein
MKTTLTALLLLLSGMMMGQDSAMIITPDMLIPRKDTFIEIHPNIWENELTGTWIDSTWYFDQIKFELELHKSYIDWCYADSVAYKLNHGDGLLYIEKGDFKKIEGPCTIYLPKHNPSPEGYVEWLENLLKEK